MRAFSPAANGLVGCYAWTSSLVLCTTTSPLVIFGGFGSADSSFCSRTQLDATRLYWSACAEVSKTMGELTTPSPASMSGRPWKPGSSLRLGRRVSSTFLTSSFVRA